MIVESLTSLEIEITEMMKRHQHITKLQSELIKEKMFIDCKLDEATAKHCYLEKSKYELQNSKHNTTHSTHHTT